MMEEKQCAKCNRVMPSTSDFFVLSHGKILNICRDCERSRKRKLYEQNKEKICSQKRERYQNRTDRQREKKKLKDRLYSQKHAELNRQKRREYYQKNKEREKEYKRKYRLRTLQERRKKDREYRNKNIERIQKRDRIYNQQNREKRRASTHNRRMRLLKNGGKITANDIKAIYKQQRGICWYCGIKLNEKYHIEHRVPVSRGGSNNPSNIVLSCPACNLSKGNKLPHEWCGRLL